MTLFEVLLALTILFVCSSVVSLFIPLFHTGVDNEQDIHMFFQQLKDDMDFAYEVKGKENKLEIYDTSHHYQYFQSGSNLIRRKDGDGYEVVLQNIEQFTVESSVYGADITITDERDASWKAAIGMRPIMEWGEEWWVTEEQ